MGLNLSGYLPGEDHNGLTRCADELIAGFEAAYASGSGEDVTVVVVGVLRAESVKHPRDPDKDPTVEVRFLRIEAVKGPEADQVTAMIDRLRVTRTGVEELPLPYDEVPADGGYPTHATDRPEPELPDPDFVREPDRPRRPTLRPFSVVNGGDDPDDDGDPDDEGGDGE